VTGTPTVSHAVEPVQQLPSAQLPKRPQRKAEDEPRGRHTKVARMVFSKILAQGIIA